MSQNQRFVVYKQQAWCVNTHKIKSFGATIAYTHSNSPAYWLSRVTRSPKMAHFDLAHVATAVTQRFV
ncbi:MAG: hypothetical protein ACI9ES_002559 [Oceanospirillaceae bacterium]|jgi:hypothetical protein